MNIMNIMNVMNIMNYVHVCSYAQKAAAFTFTLSLVYGIKFTIFLSSFGILTSDAPVFVLVLNGVRLHIRGLLL